MERLKQLRTAKNLYQKDVAAYLGVDRTTYVKYEKGTSEPDAATLAKLADYFGVTVDYLLGISTNARTEEHKERNSAIRIKVYGYVAAGIPIDAIDSFDPDNPDDWEEIDEHMARTGEFFALRIKGDSMEPKISEGDVVIVRRQPEVNNGDIAIVCVNGDEATCKKIKKTPEGIMLISLNQAYEPMFYSNKQIEELPVTILGRVVELRAKF